MIVKLFTAWGKLPWRKPLAMITAMVTITLVVVAWATGRDIPNNATMVLLWFDGVIFSWAYGTSAFEAVKKCNEQITPNKNEGLGEELPNGEDGEPFIQ